jgi:hypothetical protein
LRRGVNRCSDVNASLEWPWLSIHPEQSASSSASARVRVVGEVVPFLARISQTPGEVNSLWISQARQAAAEGRSRGAESVVERSLAVWGPGSLVEEEAAARFPDDVVEAALADLRLRSGSGPLLGRVASGGGVRVLLTGFRTLALSSSRFDWRRAGSAIFAIDRSRVHRV